MKIVSVIVPVFKGNSFIPKIIHMLEENWETVNQVEKIEVNAVFVNDYPEKTLEIEGRKGKISWSIIENEQNFGIHYSRVRGYLNSKGDYILFLDQDDEISPVYLREQIKALKDYDAVICNGKNYSNLIYRGVSELKKVVDESNYKKGFNQIVAPGQVLLRRDAIPSEWAEQILGNNGADDYLLWMMMFWRRRRMRVQDKVLYWHLISDTNTSGNWDEMNRSVIEMAERMKGLGYLTDEETDAIKKTRHFTDNKRVISSELYEQEKKYKLMLDLWMTLRERGISVENFLSKKGMKRIVVYGGGIFGRHLCRELKESGIEVVCIMDRNKDVIVEGLETVEPGRAIEAADAIVVTPFMQYTQIKEQLKEIYSCRLVSIEEVLSNADCKLEEE